MNPFISRQILAGTTAGIAVAVAVAGNIAWQSQVEADIAQVMPAIAQVPALTARVETPVGEYMTAELATGNAGFTAQKSEIHPNAQSPSHIRRPAQIIVATAPISAADVTGTEGLQGATSPYGFGQSQQKRLTRIAKMQAKAQQLRIWANQSEQAGMPYVPAHLRPNDADAEAVAEQKHQARMAYLEEKAVRLRARADRIEAAAARMQPSTS